MSIPLLLLLQSLSLSFSMSTPSNFPSFLFTTSTLPTLRREAHGKGAGRGWWHPATTPQPSAALPAFLLTTPAPAPRSLPSSLTYRGVHRSMVEALRARLRSPLPSSSLPSLSSARPSDGASCTFLQGSTRPLLGRCRADSCRVGRTDYLGECSVEEGAPCQVRSRVHRAVGTCSRGGACRAKDSTRWHHLQCIMADWRPE